MNMLDTSATWLSGQLKDHAGRSVTYHRGALSSATITATLSERTHHIMGEDGIVTAYQAFEWVFTAADIVVSGSTLTPRPGDRIASGSETYEAMAMDNGQAWRTVDAYGLLIAVACKRVL